MKRLLLGLLMSVGLVGPIQAQVQQYGPKGGSVEGREYWFSNPGEKEAFLKDLKATGKAYERFESCDMQRVLFDRRWQTCRQCGYVTKASYPEMATSWPLQCQ